MTEYMLIPYHLRETLSDILRQPDVHCIDIAEIVEAAPLHTAPPRVVDVDLLKMLVRIRDDKTWRTNDNTLWPDLLALIRKHEAALEQK